MAKIRIFSLAKKLGLRSEALVAVLCEMGVADVSSASAIDPETATAATELLAEQAEQARRAAQASAELATAQEERDKAARPEEQVVAGAAEEQWEEEEFLAPVHDADLLEGLEELDRHIAELEAMSEAERRGKEAVKPLAELAARPSGERPESAIDVPPVVTVLGHVDHGKTTLLDALRDTDVVSEESGGITQHIGASEVRTGDKTIVFIDTPGHQAFTAMRARGAQVTDVAVLVIAADDGVMPQTEEALDHIRAADGPMVVAISKIDLPGADEERVKQELLEHEVVPEELGGDTIIVSLSAVQNEGLDALLEMILLVAEVQELWADPDAELVGVVIESSVDPSQGPLATVLVRNGTISVGDVVVCGCSWGRVRRLRDWRGQSVKSMAPGHPVEVVGLSDVADAGEIMQACGDARAARRLATERQDAARERQLVGQAEVQLRHLQQELGDGKAKELNVVLKSDVWGTAQAVESGLAGLNELVEEIDVNLIHNSVGEITESDILLAAASQAIVLGFRVEADVSARRIAADEHVEVRTYDIIYEALRDIRLAVAGMLDPIYEEQLIGGAEVLEIFRVSRVGVIAGCRANSGRLQRGVRIEVTRDGKQIFDGELTSLRRFKNDAATVEAPQECGIATAQFNDWQVGDTINAFVQIEIQPTLPDEGAGSR